GGLAGEVLGRQPPEAHHRNLELGTPREHVPGLVRAEQVSFQVRQPGVPGVTTMAVLDQPEMMRDRPSEHAREQLTLVETVDHRLERLQQIHPWTSRSPANQNECRSHATIPRDSFG